MLKTKLLHPEILQCLGAAGHNSRVLIADGNYPFSTALGSKADIVFLNLMPGVISVTQALDAVASAIPIQGASVMLPARTGPYKMKGEPAVWSEFRQILKDNGDEIGLDELKIHDFYSAAGGVDVALTIATGDQRWYSNILLSIGAVKANNSDNSDK